MRIQSIPTTLWAEQFNCNMPAPHGVFNCYPMWPPNQHMVTGEVWVGDQKITLTMGDWIIYDKPQGGVLGVYADSDFLDKFKKEGE